MRFSARPPHPPAAPCTVWFGPIVRDYEEREFIGLLVSEHGVGVCCWPRDVARMEHLAAAGVPRLVLVAPDAIPPAPADHQISLRRTASNDEIHDALTRLCAPEAVADRRSA